MTKSEINFKRLLDANPDKMCLNAIDAILDSFDKGGIDTVNMRKMAKEKEKVAQCYILPLEPPQEYFSKLINIQL